MKIFYTILIILISSTLAFAVDVYDTTTASITLKVGINTIAVRAPYTGDDDDSNSALVEYKPSSGGSWFEAYTPYIDRRVNRLGKRCTPESNAAYEDEARVKIVGLIANTAYDVRVTWTDADGVSGTNPQTGSITTHPNDPTALMTGTTLYAVAGGGDTACSVGDPCSISDAMSTASPGDTIQMTTGGGDYAAFTISISGDASNYVRFLGSATVDGGASATQLTISGDYLWIDNLTFGEITIVDDIVDITSTASNVWITNCTWSNHGASASGGENIGCLQINGSATNVFVLDNSFTRTTAYNATASNNPNVIKAGGISDLVIDGNTWSGNWLHGFDTGGDALGENVDISNNSMKRTNPSFVGGQAIELDGNAVNVAVWGNLIGPDDTSSWNQSISWAPIIVGPVYVFRNIVFGDQDYWGKTGNGGDGAFYLFHNTMILNNEGIGESREGINGGGDQETCPTTQALWMYNNIIHTRISAFSKYRVSAATIDYNMITTETTPLTWFYNGSGVKEDNDTWADHQADGFDANGLNSAATFVNEASGNLHLVEGSTGIDIALEIKNFNDADSFWPLFGSSPDMGAFEFGLLSPPILKDPQPQ